MKEITMDLFYDEMLKVEDGQQVHTGIARQGNGQHPQGG